MMLSRHQGTAANERPGAAIVDSMIPANTA